ncbi:MAG: GLPGLI family protein [Muribaculaceae bacterium]|nr:GLPGLI family protein [Muribaculaceae bacterium]
MTRHVLSKIILLLGIFLTGFLAKAGNPSDKYIKEPEKALLEVQYSRKEIYDTTMRDSRFKLDPVILRIGKTKSMFCGEKKLWSDSLSKVDYSSYYPIMMASFKKKDYFATGGLYWSYIYKDFQDSICKEYEYFGLERRKYTEDLETPEWTITDSVKTIIGYECFKAITDFRGRRWIAWFTPEIPISDGPWKLHGLPGLILEAYDVAHDYEFEAKGIRSLGLGKVGYMEYDDYNTYTRDQHMQNWWKSQHENIGAKLRAAYGVKTSNKPSEKRVPKHDREEIDYDHSLK